MDHDKQDHNKEIDEYYRTDLLNALFVLVKRKNDFNIVYYY